MRLPLSYQLEALARTYVNMRIFTATMILTILTISVWYAERASKDHLYCTERDKEREECFTIKILYINPFGEDYYYEPRYELLPYKVVYLFDEGKRKKVGDSWFEDNKNPLEAYFEVPPGRYAIRIDRDDVEPFKTIDVREDMKIFLPYKEPLEKSNLLLDVVIDKMEEEEKAKNKEQ